MAGSDREDVGGQGEKLIMDVEGKIFKKSTHQKKEKSGENLYEENVKNVEKLLEETSNKIRDMIEKKYFKEASNQLREYEDLQTRINFQKSEKNF